MIPSAEPGCVRAAVLTLTSLLAVAALPAAEADNAKPAAEENGKYFDTDGNPTYSIKADGTVDWYTYSGYRRYHCECHACHGPDGMGSSYAPALVEFAQAPRLPDFIEIVTRAGRT